MEVLAVFLGVTWRLVKGRSWKPHGWNIVLLCILGYFVYNSSNTLLVSMSAAVLLAINVLAGYNMFTIPWFLKFLGGDYLRKWYREEEKGWKSNYVAYRFMPISLLICLVVQVDIATTFIMLSGAWVAGLVYPSLVPYERYNVLAYIREAIIGLNVLALGLTII